MNKTEKAKKKKLLERLKQFTLMDDDFMTRFFEDDKKRTQFVLRTILGDKIKVVEEVSQKVVKNLLRRSVRLDVFARDEQNRPYNIEIQRADKGSGAKRARYNSALMDANEILPGDDYEKLPESFIIFITQNDKFRRGFPLYHIDRNVTECQIPFDDKMHVIYVNGEYRGDDPIGNLMHDFNCRRADDMKNEILAEKVRFLKEDDKGVKHMCKIMEDFAKEEREEGREEGRKEANIKTAAKLIKSGDMTEARVKEFFNFTKKQMKAVKKQLAEKA